MFLRKKIRTVVPMALVFLGLASSAAAQEDAATKEARVHHDKGIAELKAARPDYAEAYREFKTAYAASPKWQILGSLGIAALHLERDGEAIAAFEKFLVEGGSNVPADIRSQTENDLATLKATLVRVSVTVNQSGATLVDERLDGVTPVVNRYEPLASSAVIGVRAGKHRMTVTLPGYEPAVWEFDGAPKAELSHAFPVGERSDAGKPPTTQGPAADAATQKSPAPDRVRNSNGHSAELYVAAAGTGVLLAAATATGILALGKKGQFNEANDALRYERASQLREQGQQLNFVTDALLAATVLASAGTTYLFVRQRHTKEQRARVPQVGANVSHAGVWLTVEGDF